MAVKAKPAAKATGKSKPETTMVTARVPREIHRELRILALRRDEMVPETLVAAIEAFVESNT